MSRINNQLLQELTGDQAQTGNTNGQLRTVGIGGLLSPVSAYRRARGSACYRSIMNDPTVALAYYVGNIPYMSAAWSYVKRKGAPAGAVELIRDTFERERFRLLLDGSKSKIYGWAPFEKLFQDRDGFWTYDRLKPLLWDTTTVNVTNNGNFNGLAADGGDTILTAEKSFVATFDKEVNNLYGRPLYFNIKDDLEDMRQLRKKQSAYTSKVSSFIFIIHYPPGKSKFDGQEVANEIIADKLAEQIAKGGWIKVPLMTVNEADKFITEAFIQPNQLKAWNIEVIEVKMDHGNSLTEQRKALEILLFRGMLIPERTAMQAEFSSRADAQAHAEISLGVQEICLREFIGQLNKWLVNPLLVLNYGEQAWDTVYIEPEPLNSDKRRMLQTILTQSLGNNVDTALQMLDWNEAGRILQLPLRFGITPPVELLNKDDQEESGLNDAESVQE
jgi:hypothetical protein